MSSGVSGTEGLPPEQLSFAKFKGYAYTRWSSHGYGKYSYIWRADDEWFGD